jgi:hypothetical protein
MREIQMGTGRGAEYPKRIQRFDHILAGQAHLADRFKQLSPYV